MVKEGGVYGYARVSSKDQNLNRQLDALRNFGVGERCIYVDKASGKDFERPAYLRLKRKLRSGDALVIKSIDRLGRNYDEILCEWKDITKTINASIVVLDTPLLDTRDDDKNITGKFIADLVLQLLSYVAQLERERIKQNQAEGIQAAKDRGIRFGRPAIKKPKNAESTVVLFDKGMITRKEASNRLKVSISTFDRWVKEWRTAKREKHG